MEPELVVEDQIRVKQLDTVNWQDGMTTASYMSWLRMRKYLDIVLM